MDKKYCSPNNKNNSYTCFSNKALTKIAQSYNKRHTKDQISIPKKIDDKVRKNLWKNIKSKLKSYSSCDADHCILNTDIVEDVKDKDIRESFRPEMPRSWLKNKNQWLSTLDIERVMKQYSDNPQLNFEFIGPVPIDFDHKFTFGQCVNNDLCNFDMTKLMSKNKKKLGIVFNLDPHYMSGSHWTALYTDFTTGGIYYFDSYGVPPPNEVQILMNRIKQQGNSLITSNKLSLDNISDSHTISSKFKYINKNKVRVENGNLFYLDTLVHFGAKNTINQNSSNKIVKIDKNVLTLDNPITCNKCDYIHMKSFRTFYNDIRFQFKNSECGVYSMHFIQSFLDGLEFRDIIANIIYDDEINKKRNVYYRPPSKN